jgi:hypothetical protein
MTDKEWYRNLDDLRARKVKAAWGWRLLMLGILVEIGIGFAIAVKDEIDAPLNRPIKTVSAYARILVKGDKYVHSPSFDEHWNAGLGFIVGTNLNGSNVLFSLSAEKSDVQMINILGTVAQNRTDLEFDIAFHQNHPPMAGNFLSDAGYGKPARSFDGVKSLALSMPQLGALVGSNFPTNAEVLAGDVLVTVNSSLTWEFDIPPQKQKFGQITSKRIMNAQGKTEVQVMPVSVIDHTGQHVGFFDGK